MVIKRTASMLRGRVIRNDSGEGSVNILLSSRELVTPKISLSDACILEVIQSWMDKDN